jgi:hypothetical protein
MPVGIILKADFRHICVELGFPDDDHAFSTML